jgi:hypothetical protein
MGAAESDAGVQRVERRGVVGCVLCQYPGEGGSEVEITDCEPGPGAPS